MSQGSPQNLDELATGLLLECLLVVTIGMNPSGAQSKHKQKGVNGAIVYWSNLKSFFFLKLIVLYYSQS